MEAEKIKHLRKLLGLTQEELATMVGVAYFTVVRWENNMNKPSRLSNNRLEELEKLVGGRNDFNKNSTENEN